MNKVIKVKGIPGGGVHQKLRKNMNFQGKTENPRRVIVNLTGNPVGSTSKKTISSTRGGVQFFFWKSPFKKDIKEIE